MPEGRMGDVEARLPRSSTSPFRRADARHLPPPGEGRGRPVIARLIALVLMFLLAGLAPATAAEPPKPGLPTGKGLPVQVKVGVAFLAVDSFSENSGSFKATVDLRLRWTDLRLRRAGVETSGPPRVLRGADAQVQLAELWAPKVEVLNQRGEPSYSVLGLRIYPDGQVEMTRRISGEFSTAVDVSRFPFDKQDLKLELAIRDQTADQVSLEYEQDDLDFSRAIAAAKLDGWEIGLVELASEPMSGWYGASHARVTASLEIARVPDALIASIFVPLFASLLIPLLGIWLNRVEDGVFQIETFEFVNLIVGGLFAVIALNFTVNTAYSVLGTGDNPVSRLFALNYIALGTSLMVNVLMFRFNVVGRFFGRYVQEQLYFFLIWAIPLLMLTMATSIILVAMA